MRRLQYLLACSLALAAAGCTNARAAILFDPQRHDHEASLRAVYAQLPERGKEVDVTVAEFHPDEWKTVDDSDDPDTVGMYNDETRQLFLKEGDDELEFTFAHEFGHHVYYASLTRTERRDWKRYWKLHREEMPPGDAQDDASEAFADCYAASYYHGRAPFQLAGDLRQQIGTFFTVQATATHLRGRKGA